MTTFQSKTLTNGKIIPLVTSRGDLTIESRGPGGKYDNSIPELPASVYLPLFGEALTSPISSPNYRVTQSYPSDDAGWYAFDRWDGQPTLAFSRSIWYPADQWSTATMQVECLTPKKLRAARLYHYIIVGGIQSGPQYRPIGLEILARNSLTDAWTELRSFTAPITWSPGPNSGNGEYYGDLIPVNNDIAYKYYQFRAKGSASYCAVQNLLLSSHDTIDLGV